MQGSQYKINAWLTKSSTKNAELSIETLTEFKHVVTARNSWRIDITYWKQFSEFSDDQCSDAKIEMILQSIPPLQE